MSEPTAAPPTASPAPAATPAASPSPAPSPVRGFKPSQMESASRGIVEPAAVATPVADTIRGFVPQLDSDADAEADASTIEAFAAGEAEPVEGVEGEAVEQDPWAEQVHGMTAKELVEALKSGDTLPDSLLDVLQHEFDLGDGQTQRMSLREALAESQQERMQLRDYHRQVHQVRQREQEVAAHAEALQTSITALDNHETLIDDLAALGVSDETLDAAMRAYARRKLEYERLPEGVRKALDETRKTKIELAKQRQQLEQFKQREAALSQQQSAQQFKAAIQQHAPAAFLRAGLNPQSKFAREKFHFFLEQASGGKTPTKEHIYAAAKAANQEIAFLQREQSPQQPGAPKRDPKGRPLGPNRAAAPGALNVPKQAPKQRGFTPSQLATFARGDGR